MEEAKTQTQSQKTNLTPAPAAQDNDDYQIDGFEDNRGISQPNQARNAVMDPFV